MAAVDDQLRRVDAVEIESQSVLLLACGELLRVERILPALIVPVGHVLAQRHDVYTVDRLFLQQVFEQTVGRRTAITALGREQLREDGDARRGLLAKARTSHDRERQDENPAPRQNQTLGTSGTHGTIGTLYQDANGEPD